MHCTGARCDVRRGGARCDVRRTSWQSSLKTATYPGGARCGPRPRPQGCRRPHSPSGHAPPPTGLPSPASPASPVVTRAHVPFDACPHTPFDARPQECPETRVVDFAPKNRASSDADCGLWTLRQRARHCLVSLRSAHESPAAIGYGRAAPKYALWTESRSLPAVSSASARTETPRIPPPGLAQSPERRFRVTRGPRFWRKVQNAVSAAPRLAPTAPPPRERFDARRCDARPDLRERTSRWQARPDLRGRSP